MPAKKKPNQNEIRSLEAAIAASKAMTKRLQRMLARKIHGPGQLPTKVQTGKQVMKWWNELVADMPLSQCVKWTNTRERHYQARLEDKLWDVKKLADRIRHLKPFVFERTWMSLDWFLKSENNLAKLLEGNFSFDAEREEIAKTHRAPGPDDSPSAEDSVI